MKKNELLTILAILPFTASPAVAQVTDSTFEPPIASVSPSSAPSVSGASTSSGPGVPAGFAPGMNIQEMDLETALRMVQSERVRLLDAQLKEQIEDVQKRNARIAALNELLSWLVRGSNQLNDNGSSDQVHRDDKIDPSDEHSPTYGDAFDKNGITFPDWNGNGTLDAEELDGAISSVRDMISIESQGQQFDMLRIQALTGKRNEAFEVMNNFIKKMQDSRSKIIDSMR